MDKDQEKKLPNLQSDEFEIFGEHKTREQIREEAKARKQAEREALRREMEARRAAAKETPAPRRYDILTVVIVLVAIVALGVGALALQFARAAKNERFERDDTRTEYFYLADAAPEMTDEGITAAISEVYYTKGGYLCVQMILGNGTANPMLLEAVEVVLVNDADEQIASGYAATTGELIVASQGTEPYTFYISPEHITLKEAPLSPLGYTINVTGSAVTE